MPVVEFSDHRVPLDEAKRNAILMHKLSFLLELMDRKDLVGTVVKEVPAQIFDLNGELLFYEFEVVNGDVRIGSILASGNRIMGSPIGIFRVVPRGWSYEDVSHRIQNALVTKHGSIQTLECKFVCYSYPRIGVMARIKKSNGQDETILLDLPSLDALPLVRANGSNTAWSLLDKMVEIDAMGAISNYRQIQSSMLNYFATGSFALSAAIDQPAELLNYCISHNLPRKILKVKYCSGHGTAHECRQLHAQEEVCWCVPATLQMLLCYWRFDFSQEQLASRLSITNCANASLPDIQDQVNLLNSLINRSCPNCGIVDEEYSVTTVIADINSPGYVQQKNQLINKVITEINDNRPIKSGLIDHARTVFGYAICWPVAMQPGIRLFFVMDPYPVPSGSTLPGMTAQPGGDIYWEFTNYTMYCNALFIKRK